MDGSLRSSYSATAGVGTMLSSCSTLLRTWREAAENAAGANGGKVEAGFRGITTMVRNTPR